MPASGNATMAAQDGRDDPNTSAAEIVLPPATPAAHAVDAADATTVQRLVQQDASPIHPDRFRADLRFAGIDGQRQTVVVLDTGIDLNHSVLQKTSTSCFTLHRSRAVGRATG